jgi:3-hydroxybutyryl-CoA dehydrogenase
VLAVIGGGLMGAGIAQVFAVAGHEVTVFEPLQAVRDTVLGRIAETLSMVGADSAALDHVTVTDDFHQAVAQATLVTEAAPEKLDIKRNIFADLITHAPRDCIFASNSSVIPITRISEGLATADRMVGTHWWNPPYLIPLVEVIQGAQTSDAVIAKTMTLLSNVGKMPAHVVKDTPGFVANRLQHALWREAIAMVAEGICDAETLDACVKNSFGRRLAVLGPLENADLVGLDLTLDIHKTMIPELDRHATPHELLQSKVADGKLGFKSGEGFRRWTPTQMQDLRERLVAHLCAAQSK